MHNWPKKNYHKHRSNSWACTVEPRYLTIFSPKYMCLASSEADMCTPLTETCCQSPTVQVASMT